MAKHIVAQSQPNTNQLRAHRAKLMTELRELEGLPKHQLRRRYYEIHPQLQRVCSELSKALTAEGVGRITQNTKNHNTTRSF